MLNIYRRNMVAVNWPKGGLPNFGHKLRRELLIALLYESYYAIIWKLLRYYMGAITLLYESYYAIIWKLLHYYMGAITLIHGSYYAYMGAITQIHVSYYGNYCTIRKLFHEYLCKPLSCCQAKTSRLNGPPSVAHLSAVRVQSFNSDKVSWIINKLSRSNFIRDILKRIMFVIWTIIYI